MLMFFDRISGKLENSKKNIIESVISEIAVIISNRSDPYWAYNFKTRQLSSIAEAFQYDIESDEFIEHFKESILAFIPKLSDVQISTRIDGMQGFIDIVAYVKFNQDFITIEHSFQT
jgi:hypothetical protein